MNNIPKEYEDGQELELTLTDGVNSFEVKGLFFNWRIKPVDDWKVAGIRHYDDDDSILATLEPFVKANHFGDFAYKGDDLFTDKNYLRILDWNVC